MTKHLHRLSHTIQEQLIGTAALHPPEEWARHAPRIHLDAWASLLAWHAAGEPIVRISAEQAEALQTVQVHPDIPLEDAPLKPPAVAIQLPQRGAWIVIARHAPAPCSIPVYGESCADQIVFGYAQPLLTYCAQQTKGDALQSGYINLTDQPTPAQMTLYAGTVTDTETGIEAGPLSREKLAEDMAMLRIAVGILYREHNQR